MAIARNVLVILGANSISFYLAVPLWLPFGLASAGRLTDPETSVVLGHGIIGLVLGLAAGVAGIVAGWVVEGGSSRWWGVGLSGVVAAECFAREHWRIPNREYLMALSLEAVIVAGLSFAGYLVGERLRTHALARGTRNRVAG